jgi:nucleoside-diphosphate-sugar epimerase
VSIDLEKDGYKHKNFRAVQGDIRNRKTLEKIFSENSFDAVFHLAAILAHSVKDKRFLWTSNVDGTREIQCSHARFYLFKLPMGKKFWKACKRN